MKTEADIQARIRELLGNELDRRMAEVQQRLPQLCQHNIRHTLDSRKKVEGEANENYNCITNRRGLPVLQTIGLCGVGQEDLDTWPMNICDEPVDAKRCNIYNPIYTKEVLIHEFEAQIKDMIWLKSNLPEVHALLWVISEVDPADRINDKVKISWWKRLLFAFKRFKIERLSLPQLPH